MIDISIAGVTFGLDLVILGVLFYAVGAATVIAYGRLKRRGSDYHADDAVVEAVVLEYTRRLRNYDRVIAEMRTKLDIVEMRLQAVAQPREHAPAHVASQPAPSHMPAVSEPVAVTQRPVVEEEKVEGGNGTIDYILKLLVERPRTSREVQNAVGRTREHTARLMKKLYETGFVSRDMNSKPFRYAITEAGRTRLREKPVALPEIQPHAA